MKGFDRANGGAVGIFAINAGCCNDIGHSVRFEATKIQCKTVIFAACDVKSGLEMLRVWKSCIILRYRSHMRPNVITGMSREEYLAFERASSEKHEYRGGEIVAMSGARWNHNIIAWNLGGELRIQFKGRDCSVCPGDLRVYVPSEDLYAYPDLVVVCGDPEFQDEAFDTLLNPVLIIEILSDTTEAYDRGDKSEAYRTITSLREYALVSQNRMHIEKYAKHGDGFWMLSEVGGADADVIFESIGCTLSLKEVYDKVQFAAPDMI